MRLVVPAVNELEYELTDHLGNVRATFTRDAPKKVTLASSADYYPYGTKIPGSWTGAGGAYRYGYQGQYAEDNTDETGYSNFEARMLDNERARWFVPDPTNQYWSGYVAMGNNPVSYVDPTGEVGEEIHARFDAWWNNGTYKQTESGAHVATWNDGTNVVSNYYGKSQGLKFSANISMDFNLGASASYGGQEIFNASFVSAKIAQSGVNVNLYSKKDVFENDSYLIGYGKTTDATQYNARPVVQVKYLELNGAGVGYTGGSFDVTGHGNVKNEKSGLWNGSLGHGKITPGENEVGFGASGGALLIFGIEAKLSY